MGRMKCECGNILSDSTLPNDVKYLALVEDDTVKQVESFKEGKYYFDTKYSLVWYCSKCERFYVMDRKKSTSLTFRRALDEIATLDEVSKTNKIYIYDTNHMYLADEYMKKGEILCDTSVEGWFDSEKVYLKCKGDRDFKVFRVETEVKLG